LTEGENATSPGDTSKMLSGMRMDISEQDTIAQILIVKMQLVSQPSSSTLKPCSGDSWIRSTISIESPDPHLSNTDFKSLMKKGLIEAGGDQLMEQQMKKKNHLPLVSDSEVMVETPQTQIPLSPLVKLSNMQLLHWLNSFPHTLPDPASPPSADYLRWLPECHKLHQLPLWLQQAYWPELLELEYPQEEHNQLTQSETPSEEEEDLVEDLLEKPDHQWDLLMEDQTKTLMLEEGEILYNPLIIPKIGSPTN
jgi:hypothetical protein